MHLHQQNRRRRAGHRARPMGATMSAAGSVRRVGDDRQVRGFFTTGMAEMSIVLRLLRSRRWGCRARTKSRLVAARENVFGREQQLFQW